MLRLPFQHETNRADRTVHSTQSMLRARAASILEKAPATPDVAIDWDGATRPGAPVSAKPWRLGATPDLVKDSEYRARVRKLLDDLEESLQRAADYWKGLGNGNETAKRLADQYGHKRSVLRRCKDELINLICLGAELGGNLGAPGTVAEPTFNDMVSRVNMVKRCELPLETEEVEGGSFVLEVKGGLTSWIRSAATGGVDDRKKEAESSAQTDKERKDLEREANASRKEIEDAYRATQRKAKA